MFVENPVDADIATVQCCPAWNKRLYLSCRTCPVYKRVCQPNDEDGATTAPVHLLTGHVRSSPLPRLAD